MNRLREVREARGLTATELGRRMRVDPSTVRHVEAGRLYPYPKFRRGAARVLGVTERDLFGTEEVNRTWRQS
jgi:transcriptional regulator with XRE-family HTH domain